MKLKQTALLLFALFTFFAASAVTIAASIFKGEVDFATSGVGKKPTSMKYFSNGKKIRVDMDDTGMAGSIILDPVTKKMLAIIPKAKKYMEVSQTENQAPKKIATALAGMKNTGKTETLLGHTCQIWSNVGEDGTEHQVYVAEGMGVFYFVMGGMRGRAEPPALKKMRELGLFPLRMVDMKDGQEISRMEATKIDTNVPDASFFEVPAGYDLMDMGTHVH